MEKGADPSLKHNGPAVGMKEKGLTALEMISPRRHPELKHMHKLLIQLVERKDFNQQDQQEKQAVIEATSKGDDDELKDWIVSINTTRLQRSDYCIVTALQRKGDRRHLQISLLNSTGSWSRTPLDPPIELTEELLTSKLTLHRKATRDELIDCNAFDEARQSTAGGRLKVVANEPVPDPQEDGKWRFVFQVQIETATVHEISGRFSELDKKYSKLPELLGCADTVKFPPRDFLYSKFRKAMESSAREERQVCTCPFARPPACPLLIMFASLANTASVWKEIDPGILDLLTMKVVLRATDTPAGENEAVQEVL